jgi:RecB family exonuclease
LDFKNPYLSYSRLTRFEQCPLAFKFHYIDQLPADPGVPLRFGKAVHAVLERLMREVIESEHTGPLSEARALELYRQAWNAEALFGVELFGEGLRILESFIRDEGHVDHRSVLAVEREFRLRAGPFEVLGYLDRVDAVDAETVEVIDYKTNRQLFTREDLDSSLQMSLYALAAKELWPWVKRVKLVFRMLRHGVRQETSRTDDQLRAALAYAETLGHRTETATEFPAQLSTNCCYCDHRKRCPAYAEALKNDVEFKANADDLEEVAREREDLARRVKLLSHRKDELDRVLKTHLRDREELELAGFRYRMFNVTSLEYPPAETLALLARASGRSREDLLEQVVSIDKKALDGVLKGLSTALSKSDLALLKAELDARADKHQSPRLWAKKEVA